MNPNPHELAPILLALGRAGIELAAHGDRLRHRPAVLPPDLSEALRRHRGAILGLLVGDYAPAGANAGYVIGERLGMADGLGMPTHPGSPAWLVAVGASMGEGCGVATHGVHSGHGETNERDSGSDQGKRANALRDRQGRERGP